MAGFNKGCHIVASDYGNMLLIKGDGSAEEPTLSAADALAGYINVSMFTQTDFPVNTPVRFHFVSKVVGDPITADYKISVWNFGGATTNVPLPDYLQFDRYEMVADICRFEYCRNYRRR